jgi:tRNA threonylcarbamoyladenosine biosynthesis protein TsaB
MKTVLGLDTATPATAVALRLSDGNVLEARDDPAPGERPGHSSRLLELAAGLLERAATDWRELELIAVGLGPGTFTGLRIGVASARGLAQSLGIALSGVSSLAALAQPALALTGDFDGVLTVLDARRGEAFAAAHTPAGELIAPHALAPEALPLILGDTERTTRWLAIGDGALRFGEILRAGGFQIPPEDSPLHLISGRAICELGELITPVQGQLLLPEYGRRPDAEIALEGASK